MKNVVKRYRDLLVGSTTFLSLAPSEKLWQGLGGWDEGDIYL